MKKILLFACLAATMLTSCDKFSNKENEEQQAQAEATAQELQEAITERDELIEILNGITQNIEDIKEMEKIITINGVGGEGASKSQLNSNIEAIRATLADRRLKLASLEAKLKESKSSNAKLLETVESLKARIATQEAQINDLTTQLASAHQQIRNLGDQVETLNTTVNDVTEQRDIARQEAERQSKLANACYYAIGSKKELKEHDILEGGGFLRKTKIMQGEFDKSFFTQADKRTLREIQLHSNKAKVVSKAQPKNSYSIDDVNGQKVLRITNPDAFWATSNYVVIQID